MRDGRRAQSSEDRSAAYGSAGFGPSGSVPHLRSPIRELSLAQAIVDLATRHARGRTVAAIELRVGREREVAPEQLDFAFALLTVGTALDGVAGGDLALDALRLHDTR